MRHVSRAFGGLCALSWGALELQADAVQSTLLNLRSSINLRTSVTCGDVPPLIASPQVRDLVAQILDDRLPVAKRQELIQRHSKLAADLIGGLTDELTTGSQEELRRIPWIWRIAIGAGKGNDPEIIRAVLEEALPEPKQPLHDWRGAVIGGGIINGLGQLGLWPTERMEEILADQKALLLRWQMALDEAANVVEDEKETLGARYDAMRMLGVDSWDKRGPQLARYLQAGVHPDLQMGAISALADMDHAGAVDALMQGLPFYSEKNRHLALNGLMHGEVRQKTLIEALELKKLPPTWVTLEQREKLYKIPDATWRARAQRVFQQ